MGRIIRFNPDRHEEARNLLPWYVNGQLDEEERARVEAHLHDCAECQAELRLERRLAETVAELPFDVDEGWTEMRRRILAQGERRGRLARLRAALVRPGGFGWAIAAQFVMVAVMAGFLALPLARPARYHALGATPPAPAGDVIVIFQPEAKTEELTRLLKATGARLVDGPTEADAYVLDVPRAGRAQALSKLRADTAVAMAEPIDPTGEP
jgi:anti-sigma factor RsiW